MPKIDIAAVPGRKGSGYPSPFDAPCADRIRQRLGDAGGLTDFGVNLMRLPPGGWSSQRSEQRVLSPRDISSRSSTLSACEARFRSGGRMPPVGESTENTDEDSRSNRRPIELIDSPAFQRSQISALWAAE